ncbi:MAG: FAD:protein FMN transferase [Bacteroidales bacterium]|jgi:thiamine biosynthesis lipoprotein|nr:FAD:protein FMN transferase [Bacteroidales bacterium]
MKKISLAIYLISLLLIIYGCFGKQSAPYIFQGETQGTYYKITYYADDSIVNKAKIEERLKDFLQTASLWEENSIISRINRNESVTLNLDFIEIFNVAKRTSQATNGAFDITVGGLVKKWGFGYKANQELPIEVIDSLLQYVGYQNIDIIDRKVVKTNPEIQIDFNAIAKGYSVDIIAHLLESNNIESFIVDIGGEIYAKGRKPDGSAWNIGIEKPAVKSNSDRTIQTVISISDKAVATSGTYRKYREIDGVRYSHTIDPKTGYPVSHSLLSATVIADLCVQADALATAFMVMGVEKAIDFLKKHPYFEAYFIFSDENGNLHTSCTDGFKNLIL